MNPKPAISTAVVTLCGLLVGVGLCARAYVVQHHFRAQPDSFTLLLGAGLGASLAYGWYQDLIGYFPPLTAIGGIASMCWNHLNDCDGTIILLPVFGLTLGAAVGLRIDHDRGKWLQQQADSEVQP